MKKIVFILFSGMLFFGCSTIQEPAGTSSSLLIGKIVLAAKGYEGIGHVSVNGIHKMSIDITMENTKTGEKYVLTSNREGMFYSTKIPAGEYYITKLFFQYSSNNAWAYIYASPESNFVFQIVPGKVYNLGVINWLAESRRGVSFQFNKEYDAVYDEFKKSYKDSLWLGYEWIKVSFNKQGIPTGLPLTRLFDLSDEESVL